ncbi:FtsX-like permease family protein [Aminipila butyrica]|uniref:Putative hemin transport system permease protein HrtB n=1 Tax=Aminipila butyrica TaxID=433296 RepID=A0A858BXK9_9FIRM|nr:ABC transporter permease [Aminipila butyrica]QIB69909.1 FtsX-like permease family protein [Aminipila butyrica]
MDNKPLTTVSIAIHNLKRKPFRSTGLILIVAIFAFVLFGGTMLSKSLENGMDNLSKRMGADILAVPYGYEGNLQSALLRGEPSTFYFDVDTTEKVASVEGVEAASPQLYIATLSAGCCAYPLQLIGFDPETDFVIQPWMSSSLKDSLADGQIVIGSSINAEVGQKLRFFDQNFLIAGRLEKTGMGFDTSVFMNLSTAKKVARESERLQAHPVAENTDLISSIMVKIKNGYEVKDVANNILQTYAKENVHVVVAKNMMNDISSNLQGLTSYIFLLTVILWVLAVGVLIIVFSVTLNSRKREFSIFRVLGATKSKLVRLILCEACLVSLLGSLAGMIAAALVVFPFSTYISSLLGLPYLQPSRGALSILAAMSFLISFTVGPLASAYAAIKIGSSEIYTTVKEGE